MWHQRPPFPVNLRELASLRLEGTQVKYSAGVLHWSTHCLIGTDPLVVCCPPIVREQPHPIRGLSAIQCRHVGRASTNQRPPHQWVQRALSSAIGDPYKLRCASTSGSVLEYLLYRTLQTGAVGGTSTARTLKFTGQKASSRV